jgi:hypothetical protein
MIWRRKLRPPFSTRLRTPPRFFLNLGGGIALIVLSCVVTLAVCLPTVEGDTIVKPAPPWWTSVLSLIAIIPGAWVIVRNCQRENRGSNWVGILLLLVAGLFYLAARGVKVKPSIADPPIQVLLVLGGLLTLTGVFVLVFARHMDYSGNAPMTFVYRSGIAVLLPIIAFFLALKSEPYLFSRYSKWAKRRLKRVIIKRQRRYRRQPNTEGEKAMGELLQITEELNAAGTTTHQWFQTSQGKPGLTAKQRERAAGLQCYMVYYDDKFEQFSDEPSSFLSAVYLSREEADAHVNRNPLSESWDGFESMGPYNLLEEFDQGFVSAEQVRRLLKGEPSGPKY